MRKNWFWFLLAAGVLAACKGESEENIALSSVLLVNATTNLPVGAKLDLSGREINRRPAPVPSNDFVAFGSSRSFATEPGTKKIVVYPAMAPDTIHLETYTFKPGQLNSLYLSGSFPETECLMVQNEKYPARTDDVIGVRVINLVKGADSFKVLYKENDVYQELAVLNYRQLSDFHPIAVKSLSAPIPFEVRNGSDVVLTTYSIPVSASSPYSNVNLFTARHRNLTLVIKGIAGATGVNAVNIFPVANY